MNSRMLGLLASLLWSFAAGAGGHPEEGTTDPARGLVSIEILPSEIALTGARSSAQLLVLGRTADGTVRDLTAAASFEFSRAGVASFSELRVVPIADGSADVVARVGELSSRAELYCSAQSDPDPIDFVHETLPALTQPGCNSGACHGSPSGRGGFSLSLFAYDPETDWRTLVYGGFARRIDSIEPGESLLLQKPTLRVSHGGGKRLAPGDARFRVLERWLAEGAVGPRPGAPGLERLEVLPPGPIVRRFPFANQQLAARAHFDDGSVRDVTPLVSWFTTDAGVARVDDRALVTGVERGRAAVVARYLDRLVSVPVVIVHSPPGYSWVERDERGLVDQLVNAELRAEEYVAGETCDDATFLRRLSLDLRGLLPTAEEARSFLADPGPARRERIIDRWLASPELSTHWARELADLLRVTRATLGEGAGPFADFLAESWRANRPYDELVRELLGGEGPSASYYRTLAGANQITETTAQVFLGTRLECARCHNHPYEAWTQDDYYRIATCFEDGVVHPRRKTAVAPWSGPSGAPKRERRAAFADWLTRVDRRELARVEANRIWARLFGRGIVEPVDDFRSSNPPSNPALLDALADVLVASGFDRRALVREIVRSQTYQRVSGASEGSERELELFSRQRRRLLGAEELADAVTRVAREDERTELEHSLAQAEEASGARASELESGFIAWRDRLRVSLAARASAGLCSSSIPGAFASVDLFAAGLGSANESSAFLRSLQRGADASWCELAARARALRDRRDTWFATELRVPDGPADEPRRELLAAFGQPPRLTSCSCERRSEPTLARALQLMNGAFVADAVRAAARRFQSRAEGASLAASIEELYLSALSRPPSAREASLASAHLDAGPSSESAWQDLVWALFHSREFLFQH